MSQCTYYVFLFKNIALPFFLHDHSGLLINVHSAYASNGLLAQTKLQFGVTTISLFLGAVYFDLTIITNS